MPNYRNKNRNRNKNKQRNKQQQQQQHQQQQQKQQKEKEDNCKKESKDSPLPLPPPSSVSSSAPTNTSSHVSETPPPHQPIANQLVTNSIAICSEKNVTDVDEPANDKFNESDVCEVLQQQLKKVPDATTATTAPETKTTETTATTTETNDTVLRKPSQCDNKIGNKYGVKNANDNMGNEKSKIIDSQKQCNSVAQSVELNHTIYETSATMPTFNSNSSALGKVIVHRIVCEDSNSATTNKEQTATTNPLDTESTSSLNIMTQETSDKEEEIKQQQHKVILHKTAIPDDDPKIQANEVKVPTQDVKIIVHKVTTQDEDSEEQFPQNTNTEQQQVDTSLNESNKLEDRNKSLDYATTKEHQVKVIIHKVDAPEHDTGKPKDNIDIFQQIQENDQNLLTDIIQPVKQHEAKVIVHQIYLEDKYEEPKVTSPTMREPIDAVAKPTTSEVRIVEISDESLSDLEELRSPVVSEAESSIEYSDEGLKVSDSITEMSSSSSSSTSMTSTQKQTRKQKRIALEHHFLPQMLNPRFLDSISEENSELSDNYENPLSRSVSADSATNCPTEGKVQKLNAKYPKSSLDFSKPHKQQMTHNRKSKIIREETVAVAVAARLQDAPKADESCSTVRSCMSPEAEAAEVVFINSASSSMSDLHDTELFENINATTSEIKLDTHTKDLIVNKPVTDSICFESLTSSPSQSQSPHTTSAFTAIIPKQQLPEFCVNKSNNYNNNQIINNSKLINNTTSQTPHTPAAIDTATKTRSLPETDTKLNTNSQSSSPANDQLVFAQIEEQISSVLSSINEVASQHTTKTTPIIPTATTSTPSSSSSSSSPSLSSSSSLKVHTNLSNTQQLPVTTTSTTASTRTLENSCEESFKSISSSSLFAGNNAKTSRFFSQNVNMNTVRDIIINNNANDDKLNLNGNNSENSAENGYVKLNYNSRNTFNPIPPPRGSPPPPPIPPPSQEHQQEYSLDECDNKFVSALPSSISVSSYALPLLQKNIDYHNSHTQSQHDEFSQDLKSALSQLTSSATRKKSLDSHCSDSTNLSQCTAINVAIDQSDKSDSVQASLISDLKTNLNQHSQPSQNSCTPSVDPKKLRFLCAETLASFPYGETVLEELATVAQNLGEARAFKTVKTEEESMPYPLPELPHIDDLQLSLKVGKIVAVKPQQQADQDHSWLGVATINDPKVLVCLSPSQRSYIKQKPEQKPDDLLDAHQRFVERRGYHEYTKEQLHSLEKERLAEQQLLQTAAIMKKLRKSITPPPPQIPPPPVPVKSSETASKAQNLSKRTITTTHTLKPNNNDINMRNDNELIMPATINGENNGEEHKHRLLSIMQDTNDSNAPKQKHSVVSSLSSSKSSSSSAYENNSRQTTNEVSAPVNEQVPLATSTFSNDTLKNSYPFINLPAHKRTIGNMQSVETVLGQMFPTIGSSNIFDQEHKRFSNIESSTAEPFCSQIMNTQPKRYSSVETHCYETKRRIENGQVVDDFSTAKHEAQSSGDKPADDSGSSSNFPLKTSLLQETNSFLPSGKEQDRSTHYQRNDQEIMSDLNLNKHTSHTQSEKAIKSTTTTEIFHNIANDEHKSAKIDEKNITTQQEPENKIPKSTLQDTYEEFRQRAKAAADAVSTLPALNSTATAKAATTEKVTSNMSKNVETISSSMSTESTTTATTHQQHKTTMPSGDHERLFKEFDELSKQLHKELETSKAEREQREKSASMFDLNRIHMRQKQQIEEFNKTRHEHLKELEQEIERSMRSRSVKLTRPQEPGIDAVDHQAGRIHEIPIQLENGSTTATAAKPTTTANFKSTGQYEDAPPIPNHPKTYQIPIQIENSDNSSYVDDNRFRRAESMFNLSDDMHQQRQRTYSSQTQYQDDWSKYASDLGSSENIVRPFAKEVEICYQRRPGGIRAPRLTASTNDLSFNNQNSYDQYNAYNVRKHHAPMLSRAPEQSRPKYGSCYSMIERDPNPKYISTTTRRGVSPAPQPSGFFPLDGCHVGEENMRQRRASLPRELHDQQLKYITSKEDELRTEFERLQNERRRLMEEAQKAQAVQINQTPTSPIASSRSLRDHYRSTQKLPTLTEDEVFRQQMAEEWLNKVAEREKRRLQNIIKISKIQEDDASSRHKTDMGEEFLSRVKERRHKLAMPADSDWESGAESHPINQAQLSEAEDVTPMKVIEGEQEASLRQLPRHLREFAKFSNHQKEAIEGGLREQHQEEERSEETSDNSISRAFKKSSMVKTVKTLRAPMLPENHGHENDNDEYRNDNDNNYDDDVNSHDDGDHDITSTTTTNRNTLDPFSNSSSISPSSLEFHTQFPGSFDEMFGKSPFRSRIFEEFNNYWRNFHDTGNKF